MAMGLILGTMYSYLGLHDQLLTGLGLIALGLHGLVFRTMFTPTFVSGVVIISPLFANKGLSSTASLLSLAILALQLPLLMKLIVVARQIPKNSTLETRESFVHVIWNHDLCVWAFKRLTRQAKPPQQEMAKVIHRIPPPPTGLEPRDR